VMLEMIIDALLPQDALLSILTMAVRGLDQLFGGRGRVAGVAGADRAVHDPGLSCVDDPRKRQGGRLRCALGVGRGASPGPGMNGDTRRSGIGACRLRVTFVVVIAWLRQHRDRIIADSIIGVIVVLFGAAILWLVNVIDLPHLRGDGGEAATTSIDVRDSIEVPEEREPRYGTRLIRAYSSAEFFGEFVVSIGAIHGGTARLVVLRIGNQHCSFPKADTGDAFRANYGSDYYRVEFRGVSERARVAAFTAPMVPANGPDAFRLICILTFPKLRIP